MWTFYIKCHMYLLILSASYIKIHRLTYFNEQEITASKKCMLFLQLKCMHHIQRHFLLYIYVYTLGENSNKGGCG